MKENCAKKTSTNQKTRDLTKNPLSAELGLMEKMICDNCSGSLIPVKGNKNVFICEYCKSKYYMQNPGDPMQKMERFTVNKVKVFIIAAAVSFFILGFLFFLALKPGTSTHKFKMPEPAKAVSASTGKESTDPIDANLAENRPTAEILSESEVRDSIGNSYAYFMVKNTGKMTIDKPMIELNYFNSAEKLLRSEHGYGFKSSISPGDFTVVTVLVKNPVPKEKYKIQFQPSLPYTERDRLSFEIKDPQLIAPAVKSGSYTLQGIIVNKGNRNAKYLSLNGILLCENGKICSVNSTFISKKSLSPGDSSVFTIDFHTIAGVPKKFQIEYDCIAE